MQNVIDNEAREPLKQVMEELPILWGDNQSKELGVLVQELGYRVEF